MRTVLVANRKGGVGKTMIAVSLAAALAGRDQRVAIADADRQQSSTAWLHRRPLDVAQIRGLDWSKASDIGEHPDKLDWLIIDAPGALKGSKAEKLIAKAKAVLTPVQPSVFDENSTRGFLSDIEDIKRVQKGKVGVHVIANRIRPRSRAGTQLCEEMERMGYPPLTNLSDRAVYGDYAAYGLSIFDRNLASLRAVKAQWRPILNELGAG
ncbi:MAG: ParA family protein [Pseudomonadota bacterium]